MATPSRSLRVLIELMERKRFQQDFTLLEASLSQAARRFQMQRRPTPCAAAHGLLPQIETLARRQPRIGDVFLLFFLKISELTTLMLT
nr:hypothetical protein Xcnt_16730 [Xanthomonas campestris pv. centellae]